LTSLTAATGHQDGQRYGEYGDALEAFLTKGNEKPLTIILHRNVAPSADFAGMQELSVHFLSTIHAYRDTLKEIRSKYEVTG
jgi:hypothetical protein